MQVGNIRECKISYGTQRDSVLKIAEKRAQGVTKNLVQKLFHQTLAIVERHWFHQDVESRRYKQAITLPFNEQQNHANAQKKMASLADLWRLSKSNQRVRPNRRDKLEKFR